MTHSNGRALKQLLPNLAAVPARLRFYDPELQNASNAEPFDKNRLERALEKSKQLDTEYRQELQTLGPRMGKSTFSLFIDAKQPLFDADLLELSFGDAVGYGTQKKRQTALTTSVQAMFRSFDEKKIHRLIYRQIAGLNVNVPLDRWFEWPSGKSRIDSLLAHEVIAVSDVIMQHTFVFVSGAHISIRFEQVRWLVKRNDLG